MRTSPATTRPRAGAGLWILILLTACGPIQPGSRRPAPPAPTPGEDLTTWLEPAGPHGAHHFYARNDSDLIYRITQLTLTECMNVRECGAHRVDVVLCPGETRRIFTNHASQPNHRIERERVYFEWGYDASSYEPGEPVIGAECPERVP